MTPEMIDKIFAIRREKQDAINSKIDAALASNDNNKLKESLGELIQAFNEPIKF